MRVFDVFTIHFGLELFWGKQNIAKTRLVSKSALKNIKKLLNFSSSDLKDWVYSPNCLQFMMFWFV